MQLIYFPIYWVVLDIFPNIVQFRFTTNDMFPIISLLYFHTRRLVLLIDAPR
jgi:hypothetical protein